MNLDISSIVITGAGLITPLGLTLAETWKAVCAGRCGMGPLAALEQTLPEGKNGGQCPELPAEFAPDQPREVRYLRRAITDALADAEVDHLASYAPERCAILLGTTLHGMRAGGEFLRSGKPEKLVNFLAGATLANASEGLHLTGLAATTCSACSSSLGSIALAVSLLRAGQFDLIVAGGYDTISEYVYAGFNSLRLVANGPLRPFTRGREGMKLAEGYGIVVLEREEDAATRGRRPLATILGYGESADAHHLTQPHPQGEGAARAVRAALESAKLSPRDIDLIAAHATGTPDNDAAEYAALSQVFGADLARVPVVAFKSHLGHTLGGAGAVELILSALCLRDQVVPPCPNVRLAEIEFPGLNVSHGNARSAQIRATLNTSLGFGGANTSVVLGRPDNDRCRDTGVPPVRGTVGIGPVSQEQRAFDAKRLQHGRDARVTTREVFITGVGVVLPGAIGNDAFVQALAAPAPQSLADSGPIPESQYIHLLNARRVRRMSEYVKLSLAATMLACRDASIDDLPKFAETCGAILGSAHGSTNYSEQYYGQIVREGINAANPLLFAEGVPNAAAAHLSLMLALKGPCQTVIGTRTAGLDSLRLAFTRIANGEWDRAIVGAAEEYSTVINDAYRAWGLYEGKSSAPFTDGGFAAGCGAVTLILESARSMESRGTTARGRVIDAQGPMTLGDFFRPPAALAGLMNRSQSILTSANGTWIDRAERATIRRLGGSGRALSSLAAHFPECFSVTPLANVAAALLNSELHGHEAAIAVLASDYTRLQSAALIEPLRLR